MKGYWLVMAVLAACGLYLGRENLVELLRADARGTAVAPPGQAIAGTVVDAQTGRRVT